MWAASADRLESAAVEAGGCLQNRGNPGISCLSDGGARGGGHAGNLRVVGADADLPATAGQLDVTELAVLVGEAALAAVGPALAGQLPASVVVLTECVADGAAAVRLGVGQLGLGAPAQRIEGVGGAADEATRAVFLVIAGELAVGVVGEGGGFIHRAASQLALFASEIFGSVPSVGGQVAACVLALGGTPSRVLGGLNGAAHLPGFLSLAAGFVVRELVLIAFGSSDSQPRHALGVAPQ